MRFFVKVSLDTATTNEAIKNNRLGETMNQIMGDLQPEAAYFILKMVVELLCCS